MNSVLAFDVGGSRLKAGVVSLEDGAVSHVVVDGVGGAPAGTVLDAVARLGDGLLSSFECCGAGMCLPGLVDEQGTVVSLPGKLDGVVGVDLGGFFLRQFGLHVVVANDAVAFALGEAHHGAGTAFDRVVAMTIGTGVGVGVVDHGETLTTGLLGGGLLGGHIPIADRATGYVDSNGRPDTIEAFCCAQRLIDYAGEAGFVAATVDDVLSAAASGRSAALEAVERFRHHLTRAVVALAHAHTPDVVVIGGGVLTAFDSLLDGVGEEVNGRLFGSYRVAVCRSALGDAAALAGLAAVYRSRGGR